MLDCARESFFEKNINIILLDIFIFIFVAPPHPRGGVIRGGHGEWPGGGKKGLQHSHLEVPDNFSKKIMANQARRHKKPVKIKRN
jgi:hypothetical protein